MVVLCCSSLEVMVLVFRVVGSVVSRFAVSCAMFAGLINVASSRIVTSSLGISVTVV